MQPFSVSTPSTVRRTGDFGTYEQTQVGRRVDLTCNPNVTQGDFETPNDWSYQYDQNDYPKGFRSGTRLTDGKSYLEEGQGNVSLGNGCRVYYPTASDRDSAWNKSLDDLTEQIRGQLDLATSAAEAIQTAKMVGSLLSAKSYIRSAARFWNQKLPDGNTPASLQGAVRSAILGLSSRARAKWVRSVINGSKDSWSRGSYQNIPLRFPTSKSDSWSEPRTREIANRWLEYHLGVKPLLYDVYNTADEITNAYEYLLTEFESKGKFWYPKFRTVEQVWDDGVRENSIQRGFGRLETRFKVTLEYRRTGTYADRWTALNPFSVGYELLPASWVVDYFYDLGSFLRNLETAFLYGNIFKNGYVSEHELDKTKIDFKGAVRRSGWDRAMQLLSTRKYVAFNRKVLTSYPLPELPSFNVKLGSGQLLNTAAYLRLFLRG